MFEVKVYQDGYVIESDEFGVISAVGAEGETRPIFSRDYSYLKAMCAVLNSAQSAEASDVTELGKSLS